VGTTSVAATQSTATLGQYTFANGPITVASRALAQVYGVMTPALWGRMSTDQSGTTWRTQAQRLTIWIAVLAGIATNASQALYGPAVSIVAPGFRESITIFEVLAGNILVLALPAVASLVLTSTTANRQALALRLGIAGLVLNAVANAAAIAAGFGPLAIAWNDLWIQLLFAILTIRYAAPWLAPAHDARRLARALAVITGWTVVIALLLHVASDASGTAAGTLGVAGVRGAAVVGAWIVPVIWWRRRSTSTTVPYPRHL
jgi:hypothetical protein